MSKKNDIAFTYIIDTLLAKNSLQIRREVEIHFFLVELFEYIERR